MNLGGDGAPWWTLDAVGFKTDDFSLHETGCAELHQCHKEGDTPKMLWPTNYWKLATATMFSLFFAGDEFAPNQKVGGTDETFQAFLQRHYLNYLDIVAYTVKDKVNVIGFGTMNEPSSGLIGVLDLNESNAPAPFGHVLSGFESMRLGSGEAIPAAYYSAPFVYKNTETLNPRHTSVWKSPDLDVWRQAGVYEIDDEGKRNLLRPHHFALEDDYMVKFMKPFYEAVHKVTSKHNTKFVTFAEPHFDSTNPFVEAPDGLDVNSFAFGPHFYDFLTLIAKSFNRWIGIDIELEVPVFSPLFIDWAFRRNLKRIKQAGKSKIYVLLGETGIPFDMGPHVDYDGALNRTLKAVEANDLDYTLWCYNPYNTALHGDEWNGENLSIRTEGSNRGISSAVRPFAYQYSLNSHINSQHFNPFTQRYELQMIFDQDVDSECTVDIYIPTCHFVKPDFSVSSGNVKYDKQTQRLEWKITEYSSSSPQSLQVRNAA